MNVSLFSRSRLAQGLSVLIVLISLTACDSESVPTQTAPLTGFDSTFGTQDDPSIELPETDIPGETQEPANEPDNTIVEEPENEEADPIAEPGCLFDQDCENAVEMGPCMEAICDKGSCLVQEASDGTPCETSTLSNNQCVLVSVCEAGQCTSLDTVQCDDENECTEDACSPNTGECTFTQIPGCDQGILCDNDLDCVGVLELVPCEKALCEEGTCVVGDADDGAMCFLDEWDGNPCFMGGRCETGLCAPESVLCDDLDPCTIDSCSVEAGGCVSVEDPEACGQERGRPNGTPCVSDDECEAGTCEDGTCVSTCLNGQTCSPDTYCNMEGDCVGLLPMGESCTEDVQCETGACEGALFGDKVCVCLDYTNCPEDHYCATFGVNECVPTLSICDETCSTDKSCGPEAICAGAPIGECVVEGSMVVDQFCCKDAQCASGVCGSDGTCQCSEDVDCNGGMLCDTSVFGANYCVECIKQDDCPANTYCTWNVCADTKPVGGDCLKDLECISDHCGGDDICQCASDSDCGDEYCSTAVFGANACVECLEDEHCGANGYCEGEMCHSQANFGAICDNDDECLSGICEGDTFGTGTCTCDEDGDCPSGEICDSSLFGMNWCVECIGHTDCPGSQYCNEGLCMDEGPIGAVCSANDECLSGSCQGDTFGEGVCSCTEDEHCTQEEMCDTNIFSPNECMPHLD